MGMGMGGVGVGVAGDVTGRGEKFFAPTGYVVMVVVFGTVAMVVMWWCPAPP